jgi:putative lipoic acid-binding regulatory protein
MKAPSTPRDISPEESLIEYPCDFTVKVMGAASPEFRNKILAITSKHDDQFNDSKVSEKHSKNNKYLSLSLKISAQNREQLDALYTDLTACELTLWVL